MVIPTWFVYTMYLREPWFMFKWVGRLAVDSTFSTVGWVHYLLDVVVGLIVWILKTPLSGYKWARGRMVYLMEAQQRIVKCASHPLAVCQPVRDVMWDASQNVETWVFFFVITATFASAMYHKGRCKQPHPPRQVSKRRVRQHRL